MVTFLKEHSLENTETLTSPARRAVKNLAFSLLWLRFDPRPRNFPILWEAKKGKKKTNTKSPFLEVNYVPVHVPVSFATEHTWLVFGDGVTHK